MEADLRAIKQVIINLLSNAVKFTAPGGQVEVGIRERDGAIDLRVRDTGIGVASEHLDSVFEPFHQGDAALARRYEGTGLGLSVCRGLLADAWRRASGCKANPARAPPPSSGCPNTSALAESAA